MIYTKWGNSVKIIRNCGKHHLSVFDAEVTLVQIEYLDDNRKGHYFLELLRADEGRQEILGSCPSKVMKLPPAKLAKALYQAS